MLKVLKFGGSSLADAQQFAKVKAIVEADESRRVVIVSAPGKRFSGDHKITDLLYLCAAHIKYGVSCEEIFDMIRTRYLEIAHDCGLKLDLNPDFDALWAKMQEGIEKDELASRGEYFSARLMADPRIVDDPAPIRHLTYGELRELSYIGAQVLHEGTIFPVREKNIPLNIRNTNEPEHPGTTILESIEEDTNDGSFITGIAGKKGFSVITIAKTGMSGDPGTLVRILEILAKHEVNVEYIPSGIDIISLVVESKKVSKCLYAMLGELQKEVQPNKITVTEHIAVVAAVGRKMAYRPGVSGKIFAKLGENGVNIRMITQGPEELNIIVGVEEKDFAQAIRVLYDSFVKEHI